MEQFEILYSREDLELFDNDSPITQSQRFKLDSLTLTTLVSKLGENFTPKELDEIYLLEKNNLLRLINSVYMALYDTKKLNSIKFITEFTSKIAYEVPDLKTREAVLLIGITNYLLSDGVSKATITFEGRIPKKLFSFRQQTAEMWFKEYCDTIIRLTSRILKKRGKEEAFCYLISNTSYYLNKSQTFRYYQQPGETMNNAIHRIASELIGGNVSSAFSSLDNIPLFKDI